MYNYINVDSDSWFSRPHLLGRKRKEKIMAKNKGYDTKEVMQEREQYTTDPIPKKRQTGQDLQGRSNGKSQAGGNRRGGAKR